MAILLGNFLARIVYRNRVLVTTTEFMRGFPTSLEVLPGKMTRIVVQCPQKFQWKPGQHCYISIPGISKLQAHPFTIVSLSTPYRCGGPNDLVLLMRAYNGFTKNVQDLAVVSSRSNSISSDITYTSALDAEFTMNTRSWIDGPYGDFHPALERQYQGVVCVAGGSGITAALPWLVYLASRMRNSAYGMKGTHGEKICKTRTIHLIWSIRSLSWLRWAERELAEALRDVMRANRPPQRRKSEKYDDYEPPQTTYRLLISVFVTQDVDESEMKAAVIDLYLGAGVDVYNPHARVEILRGRPNYRELLPNMLDRKRNIILSECTLMRPCCLLLT